MCFRLQVFVVVMTAPMNNDHANDPPVIQHAQAKVDADAKMMVLNARTL